MTYTPWPADGCLLDEALRRTGDQIAIRKWQSLAPHYRKSRVLSHGPFEEDKNEELRAQRRLNAEIVSLQNELEAHFREHAVGKRLVAIGRQGSLTAAPVIIPHDIWPALTIFNRSTSAVGENRKGGTAFFAVRVFPALKAPNRVKLLAGLTFAEAFRQFVLNDPEVAALGRVAMRLVPHYDSMFIHGRPSLEGNRFWLTRHEAYSHSRYSPGESPIGILTDAERDEISNAKLALYSRFGDLIEVLRSGAIIARGLPLAEGYSSLVPPSVWSHKEFQIDAAEGDIHEFSPNSVDPPFDSLVPRWRGLMLEAPREADSSQLAMSAQVGNSPERTQSATEARAECEDWLCAAMLKNPRTRPKSKGLFWLEAQAKWDGRLSHRAFNSAWIIAIRRTGATAWSSPGRPEKKILAPESSHPEQS